MHRQTVMIMKTHSRLNGQCGGSRNVQKYEIIDAWCLKDHTTGFACFSPPQIMLLQTTTVFNQFLCNRKFLVHSAPVLQLFESVSMVIDVSLSLSVPYLRLLFLLKMWTVATYGSRFATAHRRTVSTNVSMWIISFADDQLHNWLLIYPQQK